jgi:hypothetical protein
MKIKVYLCGPMSDIPQHNIPLFERATADLRRRGFEVVAPHELDDPLERASSLASPDGAMPREAWAARLSRDLLRLVTDGVQAVVVLPGWEHSKGASLETFVAYRLYGLPIVDFETLIQVPASDLDQAHLQIHA